MRLLLGLNGEIPAASVVQDFDGVGLIRGEYLCRQAGEWVSQSGCQAYVEQYVSNICSMFSGRPVWYRLIDMESNEVNVLPGCDVQIKEKTTMLGLRGLRRGLLHTGSLRCELSVLRKIFSRHKNLCVLLPFVTDANEVRAFLKIAQSESLITRFGVMAEIPSAIIDLRAILAEGIDQVTIGMNDLTSLTLGASRESASHQKDHPSVLSLVGSAVAQAAAAGADLAAAGYLSAQVIRRLGEVGVESSVVHYSALHECWPDRYADLDGVMDLMAIKRDVRRMVNDPTF